MTKQQIVLAVLEQSLKFEDLIKGAEQTGGVKFTYRYSNAEDSASVCATDLLKKEAIEYGDTASVQFIYPFRLIEFGTTGEVMSPEYTCRIKDGKIISILR